MTPAADPAPAPAGTADPVSPAGTADPVSPAGTVGPSQAADRPAWRVGFIGLGLMGLGLARHTLAGGHAVTLLLRHPRDHDRLAPLLAQGAQAAATPAQLAARCDVVVLCVTGAPEVEAVVLGPDGLLQGLQQAAHDTARQPAQHPSPGAGARLHVVDCSTSLPDTTQRCAQALAAHGGAFLDAAMTGTPRDADAGTLNLLLGGTAAQREALAPLMRLWARNLFVCGDTPGAGHAVKLLHQFVVLSNAAVLAEAYALAHRAGVDTAVLGEVIASGGANSTAFQRLRPYAEQGRDDQFRFTLANALKDMRYHDHMATQAGLPGAIGRAALCAYSQAHDLGLGPAYVPHLLDMAKPPAALQPLPPR